VTRGGSTFELKRSEVSSIIEVTAVTIEESKSFQERPMVAKPFSSFTTCQGCRGSLTGDGSEESRLSVKMVWQRTSWRSKNARVSSGRVE
jgi:hypothetical protein